MVSPYVVGDWCDLDIQPDQESPGWQDHADAQSQKGMAFTVRQSGTGRVLMLGGYVEVHPGYAALWSLLAAHKGPEMILITRRLREWIELLPHKIVDAVIDARSGTALRWARLIGLEAGPVLRGRLAGGHDGILFERFL